MLFGSATDVLDRYLPDRQKHAALRGMLAFLALFVAVGAVVGGVVALNLFLAYRARPVFVPVSGPDDPVARYRTVVMRRMRLFAIGIPVFVGLIAGASAQARHGAGRHRGRKRTAVLWHRLEGLRRLA